MISVNDVFGTVPKTSQSYTKHYKIGNNFGFVPEMYLFCTLKGGRLITVERKNKIIWRVY